MTNDNEKLTIAAVGDRVRVMDGEIMSPSEAAAYADSLPVDDWRRAAVDAAPSVQKFRRMTAEFHDPEHPTRDIHGVDHDYQAVKGITCDFDHTPLTITLTMRRPATYSEYQSLVQHLKSWHPCVGFADGK